MIGEINQNTPVSSYQPSKEVADFTNAVKKDYSLGDQILSKTYTELNERSIIDDENRGQLMFNAFVDETVEDPSESWKWRGTRSMARNKGIAMHANLTANYLLPMFTAQNEDDEVDMDFSEVMRDIIEWMAMPTNSNYQSSFMQVVFGAITNPVTYLGAEFCEVYQTIKERQAGGGYTKKEILDEVLSGFKCPIWSSSQILINNAYQRNIQRQKCLIKRKYVDKGELDAKYGHHDNWSYVQVGVKSIYSEEEGLFYDVMDDEHIGLVAEETYLNRRDDTEVTFVNGVYLGNSNVEDNPIKHRDNRGAPKYNVVPFGFHRIGEHFFYFKSMMNAMGWDNMLYDAMSEVVMNRALLEVDMPVAISGTDEINSDVMFPNSVISFADKDTKITPLMQGSNMAQGFGALRETEKSMEEGSINSTISGQLPDASQKAYSVAQAQANAKKLISAVGKSIAESIVMYGDLMKDIAINHITVPQIDMLTGEKMALKYRSFMLENKTSSGKMVNKVIKFKRKPTEAVPYESLLGVEMTDEEKSDTELRMLEETDYPDNKDVLRLVNPEMFAKYKYLTRCDAEEMFTKNSDYWQPVLLNLKTALVNDPYTNQEALTRKLMYAYFQGAGDDLVQKAPVVPPMVGSGANQLGNMVNGKSLSTVASGAVA